jgi:hypothetical protein
MAYENDEHFCVTRLGWMCVSVYLLLVPFEVGTKLANGGKTSLSLWNMFYLTLYCINCVVFCFLRVWNVVSCLETRAYVTVVHKKCSGQYFSVMRYDIAQEWSAHVNRVSPANTLKSEKSSVLLSLYIGISYTGIPQNRSDKMHLWLRPASQAL